MRTEYPNLGESFYRWLPTSLRYEEFIERHKGILAPSDCFNSVEEAKAAKPPMYYQGVIYLIDTGIPYEDVYGENTQINYLHPRLDMAKRAYISNGEGELGYARILEIDVMSGLVAYHTTDYDRDRKPMHIWKRIEVLPNKEKML